MNEIAWPPQYKIKAHRRARSVKLRISKPDHVEITTPFRFNKSQIPSILEENKLWILKQLKKYQSVCNEVLPTKIVMNAIDESWNVHYSECDMKMELIFRPSQEIVLVGRVQDIELCKVKLKNWVREQSKKYLISQLKLLSEKLKLNIESISIRDQKSRWGSCSSNKSISLNYKLIFLPIHLVTHIMIHELCHIKYLNHSDKFWHLVSQYDPAWKEHRIELKQAEKFIPNWITD